MFDGMPVIELDRVSSNRRFSHAAFREINGFWQLQIRICSLSPRSHFTIYFSNMLRVEFSSIQIYFQLVYAINHYPLKLSNRWSPSRMFYRIQIFLKVNIQYKLHPSKKFS